MQRYRDVGVTAGAAGEAVNARNRGGEMHYPSVDEEDERFQNEVEQYMRTLDEQPDAWFDRPEGFLLKPDFKRAMQQRDTFKEPQARIKDFMGRAGYNRRYFVLDGTVLKYYKDKNATAESGKVSVSKVESIRLSLIPDAPEHSLDLVTQSRIYTICADSREALIRWAVAISFVMATGSPRTRARTMNREEFSVRFENKQPLLLNIKGVANRDARVAPLNSHWLMVAGFEKNPDGSCGPAEACGLIEPLDIIIGVNDQDLSAKTFNESLEIIRTASWPMTLHFLRDRSGKPIETPKQEGWCRIGQGSRSVKRRRYAELKSKELSIFRPMPGGSASSTREIFLRLKHISRVEKLIDNRCKSSEVYQVLLTVAKHQDEEEGKDSARSSVVPHETDRDSFPDVVSNFYARQHGQEIESGDLELCFATEREMDQWYNAIADSVDLEKVVVVKQAQVIQEERAEPEVAAAPVLESNLYLRDEVTGKYLLRHFQLRGPNLSWRKPTFEEPLPERDRRSHSLSRLRHVNLRESRLEGFQLTTSPDHKEAPYRVLLTIVKPHKGQYNHIRLVLGMMDEDMQNKWADALRPFIMMRRLMLPDMPETPNSSEPEGTGTPGSPMPSADEEKLDEETAAATLYMLAPGSNATLPWENLLIVSEEELSELRHTRVHCGWLYKQGMVQTTVRNVHSLTKPTSTTFVHTYKKRFFVLHEDRLEYYKTPIQALESHPTGRIDLSKAIEVRSCPDPMTPEYSLEIITTDRSFVLVPFNEEQHKRWLQLLIEAMDAYGDTKLSMTHMRDGSGGSVSDDEPEVRIRQSLKMGGMLHKKLTDTVTARTTWKPRYCALTTRQLVFYASEADLYDEEGDPLGVVPLSAIQSVHTTTDPKPHEGHGFELLVLMQHTDGAVQERLIFEAASTEDAKEWVHAICKATNRLAVRDVSPIAVESYELDPWAQTEEETKALRTPSRTAPAGSGLTRTQSQSNRNGTSKRRFSVTNRNTGSGSVEVTELADSS